MNGGQALNDGIPAFGLVLTVLAVSGLVVSRRRRSAWLLALLWAGGAALALGPTLKIGTHVYVPAAEAWHGVRVSAIMPYTWFVQIPGLAGFREAARITLLGAGARGAAGRRRGRPAVRPAPPLLIAPVLDPRRLLEAGWAGNPAIATMPTALPGLDAPIAADHSASLVVDVPFGIRGGIRRPGEGAAFDPEAQVLATADGHPRAVAYLSRIPAPDAGGPPAARLLCRAAERPGQAAAALAERLTAPRQLPGPARRRAPRCARAWTSAGCSSGSTTPAIARYLARTGFRFDYAADGRWCTGRAARVTGLPRAGPGRRAQACPRVRPAPGP